MTWFRPFVRAYRNGYAAAMNGVPLESNPYRDLRAGNNRPTWALVWARAWADGWRQAKGIV